MRSIKDLIDLTGRRALITGGAGHVALAIGEAFVELGARLAILDREAQALEARARLISKKGGQKVVPIICDLEEERSARAAAREAIARLGGLDILVHAAAFVGDTRLAGWAVPFKDQTVEAFERAQRVNSSSAFALVQEARPALSRSRKGSVILISSIYGMVGPDFSLYAGTSMQNPLGYAASKGALAQMTRYLSTALAPEIRVNSISPGGIARGQPAAFRKRYEARTPLKRMGTEEDIKGAAAYLAGDLSSYVTGHNLVVDGGWTAW